MIELEDFSFDFGAAQKVAARHLAQRVKFGTVIEVVMKDFKISRKDAETVVNQSFQAARDLFDDQMNDSRDEYRKNKTSTKPAAATLPPTKRKK